MSRAAVLVVEDEAPLRTTICAALTLVGFNAHQAENVDDALRILATQHIDAIVLDVWLPDPQGLQRCGLTLLKLIRASADHADLPVLFFTATPLSPAQELIVRLNHAYLFYKPRGYADLIDQLRVLFDLPSNI